VETVLIKSRQKCNQKKNLFLKYLKRLQSFVGSDPDSTYFIMSVWPIKNPCEALGVCWDLFACLLVELLCTTIKIFNLIKREILREVETFLRKLINIVLKIINQFNSLEK
jgi:hypothetical protein